MTARTQQDRTPANNTPPANNALLPGQLFVEMGTPLRLWTGVPTSIVASGNKVIFDNSQYVSSFNTRLGAVTLNSADLTAAGGALVASPVFTGNPTAPTPAPGDNDTSIATTAFTTAAIQAETGRATAAEALRAPIASPVFTGDPQAPTPAPGDADTSVATTAFVQAAVNAAASGSVRNIGRNLIHNPLFNIAQRGAGGFSTSGAYGLDRWVQWMTLDTLTLNQIAMNDTARSQIGDEAPAYGLSVLVAGNAGATSLSLVEQRIEGVRRLGGKTVTVSFWAVGSAALKIGVSLTQSFGVGGSPSSNVSVAGQAVTVATTWARYSLTFTLPSTAGKTFGTTGGSDFTSLDFWMSAGANSAAASGNVGVQSGSFTFWGVQLEVGSVATPLEKPDPRYDLSNCQRFFCFAEAYHSGYNVAGGAIGTQAAFPVQMRAPPTIVFNDTTGSTNVGAFTIGTFTARTAYMYVPVLATGTGTMSVIIHASADL